MLHPPECEQTILHGSLRQRFDVPQTGLRLCVRRKQRRNLFPECQLRLQPHRKTKATATTAPTNTSAAVCVSPEDDHGGVCHLQCKLGTKTCPPMPALERLPRRSSVFTSMRASTATAMCQTRAMRSKATSVSVRPPPQDSRIAVQQPGECQDGYECDLYAARTADRVCRALCVQGDGMQLDLPGLLVPAGAMIAKQRLRQCR